MIPLTQREARIAKALLGYLHSLEGGQAEETLLHARTAESLAEPTLPLSEFNAVLARCNANGWLTGVASKLRANRCKWNLNDAGEAALTEL